MRTDFKELSGSDGDEDCVRLNNCLQRDFTINGYLVNTSVISPFLYPLHHKFTSRLGILIVSPFSHLFVCLHCFSYLRLMFDPYAKVIYDYLGGIEDLRKAKV